MDISHCHCKPYTYGYNLTLKYLTVSGFFLLKTVNRRVSFQTLVGRGGGGARSRFGNSLIQHANLTAYDLAS